MISDTDHSIALARGLIRYCPICDGFEVTDRRIAVLGTGDAGCKEALFLRSYSAGIALIATAEGHRLDKAQGKKLADAGIDVLGNCRTISIKGELLELDIDGVGLQFDTLYPALGTEMRSELAAQMQADLTEDRCLIVDAHQRTSIPGLYAAGDVVVGLDQISNAIGQGSVAATTIRNDLARLAPLQR